MTKVLLYGEAAKLFLIEAGKPAGGKISVFEDIWWELFWWLADRKLE